MEVESRILEAALSQGIWAILSVALLFYILRSQEKRDEKQDEREKNYQQLLENLSNKFEIIEDMQNDIIEIKDKINNPIKEQKYG